MSELFSWPPSSSSRPSPHPSRLHFSSHAYECARSLPLLPIMHLHSRSLGRLLHRLPACCLPCCYKISSSVWPAALSARVFRLKCVSFCFVCFLFPCFFLPLLALSLRSREVVKSGKCRSVHSVGSVSFFLSLKN